MLQQRIIDWAENLTPEQMIIALVHLTQRAVEDNVLHFHSEALAPYYETTGEPLVEGQKVFYDDED